MDKLPMCRICLAQNTRMYKVVNKNLRDLYEKLTDIPFVTEDKRPILACFLCCTELKQCFRFMTKCLEAEQQFALMTNKPNPLTNPDRLVSCSGFITTPIENISIMDKCQMGSIAIEEPLPALCEGLVDIIEPKEENLSDDLEPDEDMLPDHFEPDSEGDVPLMAIKTEEAIEISEKKQTAVGTNNLEPDVDNSYLDEEDTLTDHSEPDSEGDVPLIEIKIEMEEAIEVPEKKQTAAVTNSARVTRKTKLEDTITAELKRNEPSNLKVFRTTRNRTFKPGTSFEESNDVEDECDQRSLYEVKKQEQHTQTRISEKRYECDVCQCNFSRIDSLTRHNRIHTGVKPYKCDVCLRSFTQKANLTKHIRIHTGDKPFKCDVCQRGFIESGTLRNHIRIHTGERPFKCFVCQRGFSKKISLTKHYRAHTGEKPYKCDICQRGFSEKSSLTQHIRIHTGDKPFKCGVCPRSFFRKGSLKTHIRIHACENSA